MEWQRSSVMNKTTDQLETTIFNLLITLWKERSEQVGNEAAARDMKRFLDVCGDAFDNLISETHSEQD